MPLDQFGILMKCKTKSGGNTWYSTAWNNGISRDLGDGITDPYDPYFKYTNGNPDMPLEIDGTGGAKMESTAGPVSHTRMWVNKTWLNTEMTVYVKRIGTCDNIGLRSRSKHQQEGDANCLWGGYIVNWNTLDGYSRPEVEITHPVYDRGLPSTSFTGKAIPTDRYVGFKQVTRTAGNKVLVKGYSNYTSTANLSPGSQSQKDWVKNAEYVFDGTNSTGVSDDPTVFATCGVTGDNLLGDLTANTLWLNSGTSCWLRINNTTGFRLRWFSVREIEPIKD